MATVKPFPALRPIDAQAVASVPYDVVTREEAKSLAQNNPQSFLRVIRSEIDLPESTGTYQDEVYDQARDNLKQFIRDGILIQDEKPELYLYQLQYQGHTQTGVVGLVSVEEYENGTIKVHEKTRPEKLEDRTKHMCVTGAHCGPIFLAYRQQESLRELVAAELERPALYDFTADDGVRHAVWKVNDAPAIEEAFLNVPALYIADGHHRAESAKLCHHKLQDDGSSHFLGVIFPDDELQILAYNRAVSILPEENLLHALGASFEISPGASGVPSKKGEIHMFSAEGWFSLTPKESVGEDPVESLDASILSDRILGPIFGIEDVRTNPNIDFVGGIKGKEGLEALVHSGQAKVAFSLYPVSLRELLAVADAGALMPPKSTWFEPKLRSGLLTHLFGFEAER